MRQADPARPPSSTSREPSTTPPSSPAPPATSRDRPPASTAATTPPTSAGSRSGSSDPSRPGTTRCRWRPGRSCPAIAAGNTIVLKPAEITPLTSLMFAEAPRTAGIPDGVVNIVTGAGSDAGEHLIGHPDVAMISFTGSTPVGKRGRRDRHRHRQARAPGAGRQGALRGLRRRRPGCRGARRRRRLADQHRPGLHGRHPRHMCSGPLYDAFVQRRRRCSMADVRLGRPPRPGTDLGPLSPTTSATAWRAIVDRARGYATVVRRRRMPRGGELAKGAYYRPTLITGAAQDCEIVQDEIFGPVLVVLPFDTDDEGIAAGQRHPLRAGGLRLDPRRLPRDARHPRDQGGLRLGQRPHPDHQRDAPRRLQGSPASARTCRRTPSRSTPRSST